MEKLERLEEYLDEESLDSVWFGRPDSFAWLTGGDNVVSRAAPVGVAAAGYDGDELRVVTNNIEAQRLIDEELPERAVVEEAPWYESSLAEALAEHVDGDAAADFDVPGFERVDASPLRQPLTPNDLKRYRALGREAAEALESVCRELQSDDTEHEAAAALSIALSAADIDAPVALVGGSERATKYRHYTPTNAELGDYALLSVTAHRHGLYASCTRTVAFDAPSWLEDRHAAATRVETTALAATREAAREGGTAGDVFESIQNAYAAVGYEGEWENHHQGGAAGYAGREWKATPGHEAPVTSPMAYAWNPTVQGAKSEGTVYLTEDGFEPLTATGEWPTRTARAVDHDVELERPAILEIDE